MGAGAGEMASGVVVAPRLKRVVPAMEVTSGKPEPCGGNRSAVRPPQPVKAVVLAYPTWCSTTWSECENRDGGRRLGFCWYAARGVGLTSGWTSGPTLQTTATLLPWG